MKNKVTSRCRNSREHILQCVLPSVLLICFLPSTFIKAGNRTLPNSQTVNVSHLFRRCFKPGQCLGLYTRILRNTSHRPSGIFRDRGTRTEATCPTAPARQLLSTRTRPEPALLAPQTRHILESCSGFGKKRARTSQTLRQAGREVKAGGQRRKGGSAERQRRKRKRKRRRRKRRRRQWWWRRVRAARECEEEETKRKNRRRKRRYRGRK